MRSFQDNVLSTVKPRKVVLFILEIIELEDIIWITAIFADIKTWNILDMWFVVMTRIYIHTTCHVSTFNGFLVTTMQSTAKYRYYLFLRDMCYNTKYMDFRKVHAASLPSNTLFYMIC